jgi:phospholipid/cholesterol/gamma-HCH transport system permease protein
MGVLDLLSSLFKSVVFGFIIGFVSCNQGLLVSHSTTEIPQRTIKAVVHSLTLVILINIVITTIFYLI